MIVITFLLFACSYHYAFAFDDWMRNLPDNAKLSQLTIPGTHNSYARHGLANLVKCQEWTIEEQLSWGVRFFDVRFRPCGSGFTVHHGDYYQNKVGGDVFKDFKKFLRNNPTETVLVSYKDETVGNARIAPCDNSKGFKTILEGYLNNNRYKPWIYQNHKVIPTVGEARGKMVFIDKDGHGGWGLRSLKIEDKWQERDLDKKVRGVKNHMLAAGSDWQSRNDYLYMTFCSVSPDPLPSIFLNFFKKLTIEGIAKDVNPQIQSFIREYDPARQTFGVVIFDYPSAAIVNSLVHYNMGMKKICATVTPEDKKKKMTVYEDQSVRDLEVYSNWNDNIGYVHLELGCYLSAFHDSNYEGTNQYLFHKRDKSIIVASSKGMDYPIDNDGWIGHWWSNDISSFGCYCNNYY